MHVCTADNPWDPDKGLARHPEAREMRIGIGFLLLVALARWLDQPLPGGRPGTSIVHCPHCNGAWEWDKTTNTGREIVDGRVRRTPGEGR